jgi:hypothetical protein
LTANLSLLISRRHENCGAVPIILIIFNPLYLYVNKGKKTPSQKGMLDSSGRG